MNSSSPSTARLLVTALLTAALGMAAAVVPTGVASAATPIVGATITWSTESTRVVLGEPVRVDVDTTWAPEAGAGDEVYVDLFVDGQRRRLADDTLSPDAPSLSIPIDTSDRGTSTYRIVVEDFLADDLDPVVAESERSLTVVGEPTDLTVNWPGKRTITSGQRVSVTGTVTGGPRRVELQVATRSGWERFAATTSRRDGRWKIRTAGWHGRHDLRIHVPASGTHDPGAGAATRTLTVRTGYRPAGSRRAAQVYGVRWDPCRTITYKIRRKRAPRGAFAEVHKAVALIGAATGLHFEFAGFSRQIPFKGLGSAGGGRLAATRGADLLVGWTTVREVPALAGSTVGLGGLAGVGVPGTRWARSTDGQVALENHRRLRRGFGAGYTRGELILHEIGHAVGLAHVRDRHQVMYPSLQGFRVDRYGAGDLTGLGRVGRPSGCFPTDVLRAKSAATRIVHIDH